MGRQRHSLTGRRDERICLSILEIEPSFKDGQTDTLIDR